MKVIIPYSSIGFQQLVIVSLQYDCPDPVLHHCQQDSSYYDLLHSLWHEGETFVIVEHDIIPWPGAVTAIYNCPEPWCTYPYNNQTDRSLGCTKFSAQLLQDHPGALDEPTYDKSWTRLDVYIGHKLSSLGLTHHIHKPNVAHLHAHETRRRGLI